MKTRCAIMLLSSIVILSFGFPALSLDRQVPAFGTDLTFDIMTWNIEFFPLEGQTTIDLVAGIVADLDVDLIALQEITNSSDFNALVSQLDGWSGIRSYDDPSYLYKTEAITINDDYTIFTDDWYAFPRAPFILEFTWHGIPVTTINLHLKCCGGSDNEARREAASLALEDYLLAELAGPGVHNIIVLGDYNDEIDEPDADNVFLNLVENDENFAFATMAIAGIPAQASYPSYPSFIDHLLVTEHLFDDLETATVQTQRLDDYLGDPYYFNNVSDHRPVALSLNLTETVCTDVDGDGYALEGEECGAIDCDDSEAGVNPGQGENYIIANCDDGMDNDCDGLVDTDAECVNPCTDADGDGYAVEGGACGLVDCDDGDDRMSPGINESDFAGNCDDGLDNDCDGLVDTDPTCDQGGGGGGGDRKSVV